MQRPARAPTRSPAVPQIIDTLSTLRVAPRHPATVYIACCYEPKKASDGEYRRIKVEVKNSGMRVRHRGGYLAVGPK